MKISCNIIRDILPLYAEDMVSMDTKELVEEHLGKCESCSMELKLLRRENAVPCEMDLHGIDAVKKGIRTRRILTGLLVFLLTAAIALGLFAFLTRPIYLTAEEAEVKIVEEGDRLYYEFGDAVDCFSISVTYDGDGGDISQGDISITAYRRIWNVNYGSMNNYRFNREVADFRWGVSSSVRRICYSNTETGEENILLWGEPLQDHVIELPRLVLNYYVLIALGLAVIFFVIALILKRKKCGKWMLGAGMLFLCYAAGSYIVTGGNLLVYVASDLPIYLGMILACTVLLWCAFLCGWKLLLLHRQDKGM